uniref:Retrotransposon gag domain-containing protein n=1 Tax=Brassica oleracea var. oleracea TaxID=109376 RepID=A0A0D3CSU9_BRAOL
MKRRFLGSSKKKPADSRTICKSMREELIDTLQAASIDSVNQASNDTNHLVSDNIVHHDIVHPGTVHRGTVHFDTIHPASIHTVHPMWIDTVHHPSIDTVHPMSIDTVHLNTVHPDIVHRYTVHCLSIDTVHRMSIDNVHLDTVHMGTVHCDTVHRYIVYPDTVHLNTVHTVKKDTICEEIEKIEVLILKVDENGMLRDEEGCTRNSTGQLINDPGAVIPDVNYVAEMNDFDLSREWYDWVGQDPFQNLPHQNPRNHIEEFEDLVSRSEQNEVSEYHMLCKIFPYSISRYAFSWFSQLQPGSLTSWEDIERVFLYKFLDGVEATREKEKNDKWDRLVEKLSREEEVETNYPTSTSITTTTSTSIGTSTATSIDSTTSTSIDGTTSESIAHTVPTSIDGDYCFRSTPLEIHGRLSCPQDSPDSTHKSTNASSCSPLPDVEKEITMEDFLELEEFLELEDGEKLEDLDSSREVAMEDFLELEEWLEDRDQNSKKKLDDDQHTSRGDLETSPKASIDRHQPDEIDRQPLYIIDQYPPYIIDRQSADSIDLHPHSIIDRQPPDCIDRHPWLDELLGYVIELEQIEERMHKSVASHHAVHEHQRPPIYAEEAAGFHKRVKRIHDPVKILVPCAVFEVEFPIPLDKGAHLSSYVEVLDDHQHVEASHRGLRFRNEVNKGLAEATSIDTDRIPSIDTDRIPSNDTNKPASIDATTSPSIDTERI